ncbi:MAG: hypothetical protein MUE53_03825 [Chitinophagales bacterium]|jgi:hypothetical protein|nr:hypothetical protein [Chitinophagales bacterium]
MTQVLIVANDSIFAYFQEIFPKTQYELSLSDGDIEEDFEDFDIIIDMFFEDDNENFPIYCKLKEKIILLNSVKTSIAELLYEYQIKSPKSFLTTFNGQKGFLKEDTWEIGYMRNFYQKNIEEFLSDIKKSIFYSHDAVGMTLARCSYLYINELSQVTQEIMKIDSPSAMKLSKEIENYGIDSVFETLMAIYEDKKQSKFLPSSYLKRLYLNVS